MIFYSIQNSFQLFFISSHEFSDFYFIPAAAPLTAIPDRIQKAKSVGTDKSKKNNIVKSILGNVQSNVHKPLYLRKGDTAEDSSIQKVENESEKLASLLSMNFSFSSTKFSLSFSTF